jgi:hypothetical protein
VDEKCVCLNISVPNKEMINDGGWLEIMQNT